VVNFFFKTPLYQAFPALQATDKISVSAGRDSMRLLMEALLAVHLGICSDTTACPAHAETAQAIRQAQNDNRQCGWMGVAVTPMTPAFAASLGMAEPYGAIFDQPQPASPAAEKHIEQGDVLTSINGTALMRSSDFAAIISAMAPGTTVYLYTWRNGQPRQVELTLGSAPCRSSG
jgi:membrane-associated protease RseP (regulator of RpoE activity)